MLLQSSSEVDEEREIVPARQGPPEWKELDRRLREYARHRAALDAAEAFDLLRAEQLKVHFNFGYVTIYEYMERVLGYGPHAARERMRVARSLAALPQITAALARGELTYSAVRELTRVATVETEADWLAKARGLVANQIERMVANHQPGDRPEDPTVPDLRPRVVRIELPPEVYALWRQARMVVAADRRRDPAWPGDLCRSRSRARRSADRGSHPRAGRTGRVARGARRGPSSAERRTSGHRRGAVPRVGAPETQGEAARHGRKTKTPRPPSSRISRRRDTIDALYIDRGYINALNFDEIRARRGLVVCRPWCARNGDHFSKSAFAINMRDRTITCPAGEQQRFELGSTVEFLRRRVTLVRCARNAPMLALEGGARSRSQPTSRSTFGQCSPPSPPRRRFARLRNHGGFKPVGALGPEIADSQLSYILLPFRSRSRPA